MGRLDYDYKHEPIMYGWKKSHNFYGKGKFTKSVWEIDKPRESKLHPTMKPIELISNAVLNSSKENDVVLDVFGGSGSTLIACEQLNRSCYMCELDPKYVDVIIERWENFTGNKAEKIES
jgi:DNA modification methylase